MKQLGEELDNAVAWEPIEKTRELLEAGVSANELNEEGRTPLMAAASRGRLDVMDLLLDHGADPNGRALGPKRGRKPLEYWEARALKESVDPDLGQTALIRMVGRYLNTEQVMKKLLEAGADPDLTDVYRKTPLMHATWRGRPDVVRLLLAAGANPNLRDVFDYSALMHARRAVYHEGEDGLEIVRLLREAGADEAGWADVELEWAAGSGDLDRVKAEVERGADVNFLNDSGETPLLRATVDRGVEPERALRMITFLLGHGADPNRCRQGGSSPLFSAVRHGDLEVVHLLLLHGADPSAQEDGLTALDEAKAYGHLEIVDLLTKSGARGRSLKKERGLPARDGELAAVLVREEIEKVSAALAERGELLRGIQGQEVTCGKGSLLIYQLVGHPWTVIETASNDFLGSELAVDLSRSLGSPAIWIGVSDASSAVGYDLFDAGERTEWFYDGPARKDGLERDFGSREKKRKPSKSADPQEVVHKFLVAQDAFYMGPQGGVAGRAQTFFSGWSDQELVRADVVHPE